MRDTSGHKAAVPSRVDCPPTIRFAIYLPYASGLVACLGFILLDVKETAGRRGGYKSQIRLANVRQRHENSQERRVEAKF